MDIKTAYPTKEQFIEFDVTEECDELFNSLVGDFNRRVAGGGSRSSDFIKLELNRIEGLRDKINPCFTVTYDSHINLHPFFKSGWNRIVIDLGCIATNNEYKFQPDIVRLIESKYREEDPPPLYFEKLSKVSIESIIEGMAHAKYYYYIKNEQYKDEDAQLSTGADGQQTADDMSALQKEIAQPPQQTETKTDKLKVRQIALIHVYEGIQITRGNAGGIAARHGYTSKNSGEGLFQDYTNYCSTANRKGRPIPCTPKKLKNKIELFESIVNHLSDNNKQRAIDEINILKTIFENKHQ